jgi:two-component system LytT family sensor kinase
MKLSRVTKWKLILAGWAFYGIYMSIESYVIRERLGRPISWGAAFYGDMTYSALWLLLTPVVLWLSERFPFEKKYWPRRLGIHLVASLFLALLHKGVHNLVVTFYRITVEGGTFSWDIEYRNLISYFDYGLQLYWIILLLNYAYEYYRRYQEKELLASQLETQLVQAQLQSLKIQLQPHFLFNTLNAISVLIEENPNAANVMLVQLSDLLRMTLEHAETQEVPLSREIEFLDRYLQIQQTRFGDRLTIRKQIDASTMEAYVPYLVLQPLVENALRHGIGTMPGPGTVEIRVNRNDGMLQLQVKDTGPGMTAMPDGVKKNGGLGLTNTQARLLQLYGNRQRVDIENNPNGGLQVTITMPYHTTPVYSEEDDHE